MLAAQRFSSEPRRLATRVIVGVVVASMLSAAWASCRQQSISLHDISLAWGASAAMLYALFCVANAWGWSLTLAALGQRMSAAEAICLWIRCESLRWLPGSLWNLGARAVETTRRGTPHLVCAASMMLELLFAVSSRLVIALAIGMAYHQQLSVPLGQISIGSVMTVACAGVALAGILGILVIARRSATVPRWQQMARQIKDVLVALRGADNTGIRLAAVQCYYIATCVVHGLGFVCVVRGFHPDSTASTAALIGINSAAWLVGFFAIFSPGGLIVREAFLATALAGWFSPAQSIALAVSWRVLQIVVEASVLTAALVIERSSKQASHSGS